MAKRAKVEVTDFDSLFNSDDGYDFASTLVQNGPKSKYPTVEIDISKINDFTDHPFKVLDDDQMDDLVESIEKYGVMHPVILRKMSDDKYEMIAGHRRKHACLKLGLKTIPARILELDDDAAAILMVQTNFSQRDKLLPSEKAKGYRRVYDARKHRGNKGGWTAKELGEENGESISNVKRYLRLSYLTDPLLDMVDEKKLGIVQAYDIAFLNEELQTAICCILSELKTTITPQQSGKIREMYQTGELNETLIRFVLTYKEDRPRKLTIKADKLNDYFTDDYTSEDIEKIIYGLLDKWKEETNG